MDKIEIALKKNSSVEKAWLENVTKVTLDFLREKNVLSSQKKMELSVAEVSTKEIATHNETYRGKKEPTDVLSFVYEESENKITGELLLCFDIIKQNATEDGIEFEEELTKNVVHGILHVLGFLHGKEMFELQDEIITLLN